MERMNGRPRAATGRRHDERPAGDIDPQFNTKGVTVAFAAPTPRVAGLEWRCADHPDPEMFHPTDEETRSAATAFCAGCPARELCLALGQRRDEWGIWGGVLLEGGKPLAEVRRPGRPRKVA